MARPNQEPQPQDDFPWYMKYGARVVGILGAGCKCSDIEFANHGTPLHTWTLLWEVYHLFGVHFERLRTRAYVYRFIKQEAVE